ncbi:MAG: hypothetical protein GF408_01670 [Candidatus Omnitrophica bacterium]|nr:hypothetical protein [Candidatus Omnitrophota bacterium]
MRVFSRSIRLKWLSWFLLLCFVAAYRPVKINAEEIFTREQLYAEGLADQKNDPAALDVNTFTLPEYLGEIRYRHAGPLGKLIIHIQDAHCNRYCQARISEIIQYLKIKYGVSMINLEGGAEEYDLSVFHRIEDPEVRGKVSRYMLDAGEINGAEFNVINEPGTATLWGVEEAGLYIKNLGVYRDSLTYQRELREYLGEISTELNRLKIKLYAPPLLEMDMAYGAYRAGNLSLNSYFDFLRDKAEKYSISLERFPNLLRLSRVRKKEKYVDFEKANEERYRLIGDLDKTLSDEESRELILASIEFKRGRISVVDFYSYLLEKASSCRIPPDGHSALSRYLEYVSLFDSLDRLEVIKEIERLEARIKEHLYTGARDRELDRLSRNLTMLVNMSRFVMTKTEYDRRKRSGPDPGLREVVEFIERYGDRENISLSDYRDAARISGYIARISVFYELSFRRDEVFLKNIRFSRVSSGAEAAILVTGGFHSQNLVSLFREKGYSYVSIMPVFTSGEGYESPYFRLLSGGPSSLSHMLQPVLSPLKMLQLASRLNGLGEEVLGEEGIDLFKVSVVVAEEIARFGGDRELLSRIRGIEGSGGNIVVSFSSKNIEDLRIPLDLVREKVRYLKGAPDITSAGPRAPPANGSPDITGNIASGLDSESREKDGLTEEQRWREESVLLEESRGSDKPGKKKIEPKGPVSAEDIIIPVSRHDVSRDQRLKVEFAPPGKDQIQNKQQVQMLLRSTSEFLETFTRQDMLNIINRVKRGPPLQLSDIPETVKVGYFAEGANKYVFKVDVRTKDREKIRIVLALKKSKFEGSISDREIEDLARLEGLGSPRFGNAYRSGDGSIWFFEEFIPGEMFGELQFHRKPVTVEMRKNVVRALLEITRALGDEVPKDCHNRNFIIRDGTEEAVMVDVGERRIPLDGDNVKEKAKVLFSIFEQYGWEERVPREGLVNFNVDYFREILDVFSEVLGKERTLDLLREIYGKYGGDENEDKLLTEMLADNDMKLVMKVRDGDKIKNREEKYNVDAYLAFMLAIESYLYDNAGASGITGNISAGLDDTLIGQDGLTEEERWRKDAVLPEDEVSGKVKKLVKEHASGLLDKSEQRIREVLEGVVPEADIETAIGTLKLAAGRDAEVEKTVGDIGPEMRLEWMRSRVEVAPGEEKYLLGNSSSLAVDIIEYLDIYERKGNLPAEMRSRLLQEYILHEVLEKNPDLSHGDIISLTTKIFEREEPGPGLLAPGDTPLGVALREFIDFKGATSAAIEVLEGIRKGEQLSVNIVPVSGEQLAWDRSKYKAVRSRGRTIFFREHGINQYTFEYDMDNDPAGEIEKILDAVSILEGVLDPDARKRTRIVAFTDPDFRERLGEMLRGVKREGKLAGIIPGTFRGRARNERYGFTHLSVLGLGLMEWSRAEGDEARRRPLAKKINELYLRLVSNSAEVQEFILQECSDDHNLFIQKLLSGQVLMEIRKIDFEELRDYWASEEAVLQSL